MRTAALAVAVLGGTALLAGLAGAPATTSGFGARHAVSFARPMVGGPHHGGFNQNGGNWSGYAASGGTFTSVAADWTEPAVTCDSTNDLYAPWVGIDGYGDSSVEQTGVTTDCSGGAPVYQAWYEMYPQAPVYYDDPVRAGDAIHASVTTDGGGGYTLTISDTTRGWTETTPGSYPGENASAEAILESPTAAYPDFGRVDFTNFTINGQTAATFHPVALDASNADGFEDHTSALSGGSFSVTYERE